MIPLNRTCPPLMALAAALVAAGCGSDGARSPDRQPIASAFAIGAAPSAHALSREALGVDEVPRVSDPRALTAALQRHYPADAQRLGRTGAALVEVATDSTGAVLRAVALPAPAQPGGRIMLVRHDRRGSDAAVAPAASDYSAEFGPAAVAAVHEVAFTPARLNGRPVPYTFRMTVRFGAAPNAQ
jgi:outer membrane biosynthesis protein TonB